MTFTYRQTQIHYTFSGHGEPLILLHGFLENKNMWKILSEELSNIYTVYSIDLPGHGDTEPWGYIHRMEDYATLVEAFLNFQDINRYRIIGHSMGGYVALALAEIHPYKIEKLILLNSSSLSDSEEKKKDRNRAIRLVQKYPDAFVSMAVKHLFSSELQGQLSTEIEKAIDEAKRCSQQAIINTLKGMRDRKDRTNILNRIADRSLVILGVDDKVIRNAETQRVAEEAKASVKVFAGGHMLPLEHPKWTVETCEAFLKH